MQIGVTKMDIQLQVVGIFYNVNLTISGSHQTVKDVMDAAIAHPAGNAGSINGAAAFNYGTHIDSPGATATMSIMSALYSNGFQSRVEGNHYPAGLYPLKESFVPNQQQSQYTVWQYYLFDQNGVFLPGKMASESFVERSVDHASRVVWRLVSILGGPVAMTGDMAALSARNPVMRAAPSS